MTIQITAPQLEAAADALAEVLRFQSPADGVLSAYFRSERKLGQRDRAVIAETVYGVLRHLRRVRVAAGDAVGARKLILAWLVRFEGYSLRQLDPLLSGGERQWLADQKAATPPEPTLAERCDMPDWLAARLSAQRGDAATIALADALSQPASLDIRVNPARIDRDAALARLKADGIEGRPGEYSPLSIRLDRKVALQKHPLFLDGSIEVQDEGSQLLGFLVAPRRGEMVADFCAGAGGKTLLLGALMRSTGRLYAFDVSEKRLARFKPRLARSGLSNVHPSAIAHENDVRIKRLAGKMDRVLVDAPCSGFGTLRRNPDLKWRQDEEAVDRLHAKQLDILTAAARLVKSGGRLVYATCSLLAEENDQVVDAFLAAHPEFVEESATEVLASQRITLDTGARLRLDPVSHGTDGFFAAVLTRRA
ncbi:RsmB/NOP family class I SAM-dependent RNA methyltransferase [Uliginosibacterium sp. sgz301328]|uniref:RsmB/NOP family class I SAM-dependent RNA methyltransferase n=1 Tax=Uliginosibacterium sp. sgz301328 TaxID=3243764 RepID=UPI00359D6707